MKKVIPFSLVFVAVVTAIIVFAINSNDKYRLIKNTPDYATAPPSYISMTYPEGEGMGLEGGAPYRITGMKYYFYGTAVKCE